MVPRGEPPLRLQNLPARETAQHVELVTDGAVGHLHQRLGDRAHRPRHVGDPLAQLQPQRARDLLGEGQHLVQHVEQRGEGADVAALLLARAGIEHADRLLRPRRADARIAAIAPREGRHLGEGDVLAHQVLVHHQAVERLRPLPRRGDPRGDRGEAVVLLRQPAKGGQAAEALDQLVAAILHLLDLDRVRQADRTDRVHKFRQFRVHRSRAVADQLGGMHLVERDAPDDEALLLERHELVGKAVVLRPDFRLRIAAGGEAVPGFAHGGGHGAATGLGEVGAARRCRGLVGQRDVEGAALAAHAMFLSDAGRRRFPAGNRSEWVGFPAGNLRRRMLWDRPCSPWGTLARGGSPRGTVAAGGSSWGTVAGPARIPTFAEEGERTVTPAEGSTVPCGEPSFCLSVPCGEPSAQREDRARPRGGAKRPPKGEVGRGPG